MSLLDLANEVLQNFDPAKDDANQSDNQGLPEGEYDVMLDSIQFQVYESGYEAVAVSCQVVFGDHAERKELININLDPNYVTAKGVALYEEYPNLLTTNIKYISQLAFAVDVELEDEDWQDMVSLAQAFNDKGAQGKQFILEITKSQNKAKTKEYTNYLFAKYADEEIDISDDELPFD